MRKGNKEARVSRRRVGMRERDRKFRDIVCNLSPKVQLAPVSKLTAASEDHTHAQNYLFLLLLYLVFEPKAKPSQF